MECGKKRFQLMGNPDFYETMIHPSVKKLRGRDEITLLWMREEWGWGEGGVLCWCVIERRGGMGSLGGSDKG